MANSCSHQKGNALFLILIAVILFAALAYAITKSENGNAENVRDDQLAIAYGEHQQIMSGVGLALMQMSMRGCNDANSWMLATPNMTVPGEVKGYCYLFNTYGGPVTPIFPPAGFVNTYTSQVTATDVSLPGVSTDNYETLVIYIFGNDAAAFPEEYEAALPLCNYINRKNGITGYTPSASDAFFQAADYPALNYYSSTGVNPSFPAAFSGKKEGCVYDAVGGAGGFVHYTVVIER